MQVPVIRGIIDRRMLINYRIDPDVLARFLPAPFTPKLVDGYGIGGICLIRLKQIRPAGLPIKFGLSSENAAHRFAVCWQVDGEPREGVYIPQRHTSSRLNTLVGGRLFPGIHDHAHFGVDEDDSGFRLDLRAAGTRLTVAAQVAADLPETSVFPSVAAASQFFESGALGYSDTAQTGRFDGLELRSFNWQVEPLAVSAVHSSFFEDGARFPTGSTEFDCALLMRGIDHEWQAREVLCV